MLAKNAQEALDGSIDGNKKYRASYILLKEYM